MSIVKEIGVFNSGLAISDNYFAAQQYFQRDDLLPVLNELISACDGVIDKPGIYEFKLHVSKVK